MRTRALGAFVGLMAVAVSASTALVLGAAAPVSAAGFSSGDIVVLRVGDGSSALSGVATAVFLDEYTSSGTLVQSIALPTSVAAANRRVTVSGSANSEGALALSADGRYLSMTGYDADPGTTGVASTTAVATNRVVARVDGDGVIDSSTAITDTFSGTNIRGAVTDDGSRFWAVGANGGVRLVALGSSGATTQISSVPLNVRVAGIANGQLYLSTGSSPIGVYAVGSGLPTTGGQTSTLVAPAGSPYGFVALDRDPGVPGTDTLYVADDSGSPGGGILKFSFDGTAWTARGSVRPAGSGVRGITGAVTASGVTLYATTSAGASQLVQVDDSAAFDATIAATSITRATAPANTAFRGVAFAPSGGVVGAPTIVTQPQDATIASGETATLTVAAAGTGPLTYQWYTGGAGDTSNPVGTDAPSFTTPTLTTNTSYWVRVTGPGGTVDSRTATVTIGAPPPPPCSSDVVVSIGSVQGTGDSSPAAGQIRTVRGTVVADYEGPQPALRGFYVQDTGDADAATSDGIFVFDSGANLVANGDVVQVTGTVSEFQGQTQLTAGAAGIESCGQQAEVTPVDVTLPRASATDLEPYEGMLVRLHQTVFVTEHFQLGRFGQVVVSSGDRLRQPTADIRATDQAAVQAAQHANDLNRLIVDDRDQSQNPDPIVFGRGGQPLSASNTLRGGDSLTDAVGVLTYTWAGNSASGNAYRLRPAGAMGGTALFEPTNPRPIAAPDVGGGIKIASANLLNFFNTYTGCRLGTAGAVTDCRGATSDTEYQRQLAKEVASLRFLGADVIGYMEMENDGYGTTSAVQALVDALNTAAGPGTWAFVDPDAALGVVDVAGDDAIKAGLLYRTASVSPVLGATFVDQNDLFERRPVAQTFETPNGARFTVIANHFKSKGSCPDTGLDTDQGDGQSCWNVHRTAQANELAGWVSRTVIPGAGDPDVVIVGDLNSYAGEDPIAALESAGYTNLVKAFHGDEAYSYVFDGQWGYLDYVMASSSLRPQVTDAADVHHNADEPSVLDYNTDFKSSGQIASLYAPDRFRTSDHDPVLAGLNLGVAATIAGTPPAGTVGVEYSYPFTLGGTPPVTAAATNSSLPPGLTLSTTGTLAGTPTAGGTFTFTIRASNAYGSTDATVTVTIAAAETTTVVASSTNPSTVGGSVQFTATVSDTPTGGTVQFKVDGQALGGAVAVVDGLATSPATSTLSIGSHAVTADYTGNASYLSSSGSLSQLVRVGIEVLSPNAGARYPGRVTIPITFQLTDVDGNPISDSSALQLIGANRVTISVGGAQSLAPIRPAYDPLTHAASYRWKPAPHPNGVVTISISVIYPGAPTQVVTIRIVLT